MQTSRPNAPSCNVNESEKQCGSTWWFGWSAPKLNGLFLGQCYTHPPNWMKIGPVVFAQTCWQTQTNCVANITSLAEVTKEELWTAAGSQLEVVKATLTETHLNKTMRLRMRFDANKPVSIKLSRMISCANQELIHPPLVNSFIFRLSILCTYEHIPGFPFRMSQFAVKSWMETQLLSSLSRWENKPDCLDSQQHMSLGVNSFAPSLTPSKTS